MNFAAYLAGIMDSDGSISICIRHRNRPTPSYCVLVQLTWMATDKTLSAMEKIKSVYGGSINKHKRGNGFTNGKDIYKYQISTQQSRKLLEDILPFLLLKKEQCETALELIKTTEFGKYGSGRSKSDELKKFHYSLYLKNKSLNSKNSGDRGAL